MPEITYTGHTAVPSDYECGDGQLALSLNLINENGSMLPLFPPTVIFTLPDGYKVAYIHKTTSFTHYIITRTDNAVNVVDKTTGEINPSIYYIDEKNAVGDKKDINDGDYIPLGEIDGTEITTIQAVGNTLIIVTDTAMNYYLWRLKDGEEEAEYTYLGTHLPELELSFGLQGTIARQVDKDDEGEYQSITSPSGDTRYYNFEVDLEDSIEWGEEFSDDDQSKVTAHVLAYVNKFIADYGTNAGKFIMPFFVRYAYRLYDGSLTMHSAPVLMIPSSGVTPKVFVVQWKMDDDKVNGAYCFVTANTCSLYCYVSDYQNETLKKIKDDWNDVITSIDIFVSAPLYQYDQSGVIKSFERHTAYTEPDDYCVCRPLTATGNADPQGINPKTFSHYVRTSTEFLYDTFFGFFNDPYSTSNNLYRNHCGNVVLPTKSQETILDEIRDCCNFYLLKSYKPDEFASGVIGVADDYLQSLVNREQMTDDYDSHDRLIPTFAYSYNSRLDIANIKKVLFDGFAPDVAFTLTDGYIEDNEEVGAMSDYRIFVYIRQDNKTIIVESDDGYLAANGTGAYVYFYYPNTNAYKAIIVTDDWQREVNLTPHDFLNGAYYFDGWDNPTTIPEDIPEKPSDDTTAEVPNKIYISEINDPFFFPVENIVTVGTGTILGIATAAKALSQGQFGQFPLYAFCDDGVWALSVSTEGVYSAVQPITRDVCINAAAITQLDSSVLFPTDRGIMQISGSTCACFTDILNGRNILDITTLPHYDTLLSLAHHEGIELKPIYDLLKTCIIVYDYTNQHIYVCDDASNMAYVISSKSNAWGMAAVDIRSTVNAYPEAYAMDSNNNFVDFSHPNTEGRRDCLLITRPLKLDNPNTLKTATAVIQRGFFRRGHVQSALYGSRDLLGWNLIKSSQGHEMRTFAGTPYKYFRLAVVAQLENEESIFGATLNAIERFTNKAR